MITVSPALKEAFNPNGGEGGRMLDYAVTFHVIDEAAMSEATPTASQDAQISRIAQTVDRDERAADWASYELNGFPLDGSKLIPPRPTEQLEAQIGWVSSALSDTNGAFAQPQTYTLTTPGAHNSIALTLAWGYCPARDFSAAWYSGNTLLDTVTVTGNAEPTSVVSTAVSGFNKVVVSITSVTLPLHRARITECVLGAVTTYDKSNTESLDIQELVDPLSERAVSKTMKMRADNFAQEFNIFEPAGIYAYFRDRMLLRPRIGAQKDGGSFEYIEMGPFYLKAPSLQGNLAKLDLEATDIIGLLSDTQYAKGIYRTATLASFADEIAKDAGVVCNYPARFASVTVSAYFGAMSHAQAFQRIAQATNTLLTSDRAGNIVFLEPSGTALQTLAKADYFMDNGILPVDDEIINTVQVEYARLSVEAEPSELVKTPVVGNVIPGPFYADHCTVRAGNETYSLRYTPSVDQTAEVVDGMLVVTGKKIENTTGLIVRTNKKTGETAYVHELTGNLFIQSANASAVADYLLARKAYKRRMVTIEYRGYPYIERGDVVAFNAGGIDTQVFYVYENALRLGGGGLAGTMKAREL